MLPLALLDKVYLVLLEWPMLERTLTKLAIAFIACWVMENRLKDLFGKPLVIYLEYF